MTHRRIGWAVRVGFLGCLVYMSTAMIGSNQVCADFPEVDHLPENAAPPDPLLMFDGTRVESADAWRAKRRPELIALFEWYMYGAAPAAASPTSVSDDPQAGSPAGSPAHPRAQAARSHTR